MKVDFTFTDEQVKIILDKHKKFTIVFDKGAKNKIKSIQALHIGTAFFDGDGIVKVIDGFTYDFQRNIFIVYFSTPSYKYLFSSLSSLLLRIKRKRTTVTNV